MSHVEVTVLGVFSNEEQVAEALRRARDRGLRVKEIFSPFSSSPIKTALQAKPSPVRAVTLLGGIAGGTSLLLLATWAHLSYRLVVSGKPVLPWVAWVVVCFEGVILFASVAGFISWVLSARLPAFSMHPCYDGRFSGSNFGLVLSGQANDLRSMESLLRDAGAEEVRNVTR